MNSLTLPLQGQVDGFLKELFPKDHTESFYLTALTDKVINHFDVDGEDANLKYDHTHGQTSAETTRIEQLTNWGCVHLLLAGIVKRTGPNEYQHITGPKAMYAPNRLPRRDISECRVSVRILKSLKVPHAPEEIMFELGGRLWSDDVIEAAIKAEFPDFK